MIKEPDLIDRQAVTDLLEEIADKGEAMRKPGEDDLAYRRRTAIANAARTLIESVKALPAVPRLHAETTSKDRVERAKIAVQKALECRMGDTCGPTGDDLCMCANVARAALSGKGA